MDVPINQCWPTHKELSYLFRSLFGGSEEEPEVVGVDSGVGTVITCGLAADKPWNGLGLAEKGGSSELLNCEISLYRTRKWGKKLAIK